MLKPILILILFTGIVRSAAASSGQWLEVRSDHFTVLTDSSEQQGRRILDQFERMRWIFQTLFPKANLDPSAPIVVLATRDREGFQSLEPEAYLAKGQMDLAGCFLRAPDTNYVLLRLDGDQEHPFAAVYHEYTHLEFGSMSEWIPLWLNEGLAEFFENTEINNQDVLVGRPSRDDLLLLRRSQLIPLPDLFRVDVSSPYYHEEQKGSVFYAESWALTHYLEVSDREKGTRRLTRYISLLSEHEDPVTAASNAFGDLDQLESALANYIQANSYQQLVLSNPAVSSDISQNQTRTLSPADADIVRADLLTNVGRTKEAHALLDAVIKENPENARALETMGFLAFHEGNRDAARDWYGKAVKLDPQNYLPSYYYALMTMGSEASDEDTIVESSLLDALRLKPDFAPASNRLALFYALRHTRLEDARDLSLRAIELDPASFVYRMDASSILMSMQDFHNAETITKSAIRVAKRPEQWQAAQSRLAQLKQIDQALINRNVVAEMRADTQGATEIVVVDKGPRRAKEVSDAHTHQAEGVISKVTCHYPFVIDFQVIGARTSVIVSNSNYLALDLTAVGFTPKGEMDPCKDFEGRRARVEYGQTPDKSVDGKVTAVELRN
jgi:tetratricopeptide (TPR) repeat protein